jgi:hypothetical protein
MANALYPLGKKAMLQGGINMSSGDVKVALIDLDDYTYSNTHQFYSDLAGVVAVSASLSGKTFGDDASFDSNDPILNSATGDELEAIVIFIETGNPATSPLILFQDTGITGMPLTPDGSDVKIVVDSAGWFKL